MKPLRPVMVTHGLPKELYGTCQAPRPRSRDPAELNSRPIYIPGHSTNSTTVRFLVFGTDLPKPLRPLGGSLGLSNELYGTCLASRPRSRDPYELAPPRAQRIYIYRGHSTNSTTDRF